MGSRNELSAIFASNLVQYRKILFFIGILLVIFLSSQLSTISFSTNSDYMFEKDDPLYLSKSTMENEFSKEYTFELLLVFSNETIYSKSSLRLISNITNSTWLIPYVKSVTSIANYQYIDVVNDDLSIQNLIELKENYTSRDIERVRQAVDSEPGLDGYLVNSSRNIVPIRVSLNIDDNEEKLKTEITTAVNNLVGTYESRHPSIEILFSGQLAMDATQKKLSGREALIEIPMVLMFLVFIGIYFRSFLAFTIVFVIMAGSVFSTLGAASVLGYSINGTNILSVYLVLFLSIVDCIHVLSSYWGNLQRASNNSLALTLSLKKNLEGLFYTTITTAIGFLALLQSGSPGFQQLGVIGACGAIIALILTLLIAPTLLLLKLKKNSRKKEEKFSGYFFYLYSHHEQRVLVSVAAVSVLLFPFILNVYMDDIPIETFPKDEEVRVAYDLSSTELSGPLSLSYVLDSGYPDGVNDIKFVLAVEKLTAWLNEHESITRVKSYNDTIKKLNLKLHQNDIKFETIPRSRELLAQYGLLYELSIPKGVDLSHEVTADKQKYKIDIFTKDINSAETVSLFEEINAYLELEPDIAKYYSYSHPLMYAYTIEKNIGANLKGWSFAFLFVLMFMFVITRSFKMGIVSMIPNVVPFILVLSVWGLFFERLNLGSVMLLIGMGIIVDDTIHFIIQYKNGLLAGLNEKESIREAYNSAGTAIIISTVVLGIGFVYHAFFSTTSNSMVAYSLLSILVITAGIFDLLVLPSILVRFRYYSALKKSTKNVVEKSTVDAVK